MEGARSSATVLRGTTAAPLDPLVQENGWSDGYGEFWHF